eukprot:Selendium_serpulae@DN5048_c0_g2_i1.p1
MDLMELMRRLYDQPPQNAIGDGGHRKKRTHKSARQEQEATETILDQLDATLEDFRMPEEDHTDALLHQLTSSLRDSNLEDSFENPNNRRDAVSIFAAREEDLLLPEGSLATFQFLDEDPLAADPINPIAQSDGAREGERPVQTAADEDMGVEQTHIDDLSAELSPTNAMDIFDEHRGPRSAPSNGRDAGRPQSPRSSELSFSPTIAMEYFRGTNDGGQENNTHHGGRGVASRRSRHTATRKTKLIIDTATAMSFLLRLERRHCPRRGHARPAGRRIWTSTKWPYRDWWTASLRRGRFITCSFWLRRAT